MIQHIRPFTIALPTGPGMDEEEYVLDFDHQLEDDQFEADAFEAEFDDSLDHLLKHALKTTAHEPDTGHVWQQLSRRVQGPFGFAALEAPDFNSMEAELLSSGGRIQQAPFVLNDQVTERGKSRSMERRTSIDCLCDMLRGGASGRALGGFAGLLW